jgi:hypothetical protein
MTHHMPERQRLARWLIQDAREANRHPDFPVGLIFPFVMAVRLLQSYLEE